MIGKTIVKLLTPIVRVANYCDYLFVKARHAVWEQETKLKFGSCGSGVFLNGFSTFISPENINIGDNVHIGQNAWFRADGGIVISDNTHISRNCVIFTSNHNYVGKRLPYDETFIKKPVFIGKNVWIGMNVMIIQGVHIGDGAIIALGTVVVNDVPPLTIVGGQPHRVIGSRDREHYEALDRQEMFGGRGGAPLDE